jgi:hypothetical protein
MDPASAAARLALWVVPMPQHSCGRTCGEGFMAVAIGDGGRMGNTDDEED